MRRRCNRRMPVAVVLLLVAVVLMVGCAPPVDAPPSSGGGGGEVRIASLAPNVTEIVCAIGGAELLVCRSSACDYPPDVVARLPIAGGFGTPSLEALAAAKPTLVLETDLADESLAPLITRLGLRRERLPSGNVAEILWSIARTGELIGRESEAAALVARLETGMQAFRDSAAVGEEARPLIYVEIWHDPPVTAGKGSFVSDLVRIAGGRNAGDVVARDYFNVSAEWVVQQNPDLVLAVYMDTSENSLARFAGRPGWSELRAVKVGNIFPGSNSDVLLRPGPRFLEGVEIIHRCIAAAK